MQLSILILQYTRLWQKADHALHHPTQKPLSVSVLGMKRSHIITITLSSLPSPHLLPPAIYSMDTTVLDREDIQVWETERHKSVTCVLADFVLSSHSHPKQRLQFIMPTDEELCLIKEAKSKKPHCPLAPAELCLLTLGQISYLSSRLQLWAFALDYDSLERVLSYTTMSQIYIKMDLVAYFYYPSAPAVPSILTGDRRASLSS